MATLLHTLLAIEKILNQSGLSLAGESGYYQIDRDELLEELDES